MIRWLKNRGPEIVSIHIPKTGGTSFWRVLEHVYAPEAVQRVFPGDYEGREKFLIERSIRALHGHIRYRDLGGFFNLPTDVKVVTWLRDPTDRVISNFHYLVERREMREPDLLEYAARGSARNRMSRFLKGADLDDFFFVGVLEKFWEDCTDLGRRLKWADVPHIWENVSDYTRRKVPEDARREIRLLNQQDEELYRRALDLRSERLSRVG